MLAPTHSVFGIFLTLIILAVFGVEWGLHWTIILFAILGSIIPDIDHPRSVIGKLFLPISIPLERRYGHRTFTHSLIGWVISSVLFAVLVLFVFWILGFVLKFDVGGWDLPPRWIAAFSISYFSHLVLDMFNKRGSQMFWPDPRQGCDPQKSQASAGIRCKGGGADILRPSWIDGPGLAYFQIWHRQLASLAAGHPGLGHRRV